MAQAVPQIAALNAPLSWRTVDFISDLHLQASEPATFAAWTHYMQSTSASALFILGDLFEAWVGDDVIHPDGGINTLCFEAQCAQTLRQTADRLPVFFMHGNRDFLVGSGLMNRCNATLLADPTVLVFKAQPDLTNQRWLLSHGDALCVDDVEYMHFRQQVRSIKWQQDFLAKPLAERQAIARALRQNSEDKKKSVLAYADVDASMALQWLLSAEAHVLIHGHTHKPAVHDLDGNHQRIVLSDWDAQAAPPRAQVLRLSSQGLQRIDLL